ncbi:MAG: DUF805 domain-containing protein [Spirochaetaceae bacterium]|nr:DUF805 domain-containing protein [Spirochaetaceae bacterium]
MLIVISGLAIPVRRLHDINKPGWHLLALLIFAVGPIKLLMGLYKDGDIGDNRFGPDPSMPTIKIQT